MPGSGMITFNLSQAMTTSVVLTGERGETGAANTAVLTLTPTVGSAITYTATMSATDDLTKDFKIPGLTPGTTYTITGAGDFNPSSVSSVTTLADTPKVAMQSQWEDLANRIKTKSDIQIAMTTTDPGEGAPLAENHYIGVYGGDPIIMDYSTNEVNTGAKWIDGSAIYKKTVNFGALPNTGTKSVNHNISNLSFVIKAEAYAHDPSGDDFTILPIVSTSNFPASFAVSSTAVKITTTNDRTAYTESCITLYYTKSS